MAGEKAATILDVAREAGVAPSTVSRVINGRAANAQTKAAVLAAVEALGFQPDPVARSLRARETRMVGMLVANISNPLFATHVLGAERVLRERGYLALLGNADGSEEERKLLQIFMSHRVDGLLLSVSSESDPDLNRTLAELRIPLVMLDREMDVTGVHKVVSDHRAGMRDAVNYLIDLGHRRIGFVGGSLLVRHGRERAAGFRDTMASRGVPVVEDLVRVGAQGTAWGATQTAFLLDNAKPPTAVIVGGNQIGMGALEVLRRHSVRIPEDISLIICEDVDAARLNSPPITVIKRDNDELGQEAARLLLDGIDGRADPAGSRIVLPTHLVVRASCRAIVAGAGLAA